MTSRLFLFLGRKLLRSCNNSCVGISEGAITAHFSEVSSFAEFKVLASRTDLTNIEKIGFPEVYRAGFEEAIFDDIAKKLNLATHHNQKILDIGSGCSSLPTMFHALAKEFSHDLYFLDSFEMLSNLPDEVLTDSHQIFARFPECAEFLVEHEGEFDAVNCYSVIQYAFNESSIFDFLDALLQLLRPGGRCLIGDIPNSSMKKRFLASDAGLSFHREHFKDLKQPEISWNSMERGSIDDSVVLALISRARAQGLQAFVVPQNSALPLSNRREDILIVKP